MSRAAPHVAVTGAAGYLGSRVVYALEQAHPQWEVTAVDDFYRGEIDRVGAVEVEHVDVRDRDALESALAEADVICHLAALSGVEGCDANPDLAYEVNVQGTENVAWYCRKSGAGLVMPLSMAVLGDPERFPITADLPRQPMNWYGRTKLLNERAVETLADGAFPAHLFLVANLYGAHEVAGQRVSKQTVINIFLDRALTGDSLTVHKPGDQARNYVHVKDVAAAHVRSCEHLLDVLSAGETGAKTYEIGSEEDPGVMTLAETVQRVVADEAGIDVDIELVENPRSAETLVQEFGVDTGAARTDLDWEPTHTIEETIRDAVRERTR
jgi:UDP-glucose 4-epimerase